MNTLMTLMTTLLFTPYTASEPMGMLIAFLFFGGLYAYLWYASTDVLKATKRFGGDNFSKVKWLTFIPVVNILFTLVITQIEMAEYMSEMMVSVQEQWAKQMEQAKKNYGK